MIFQGKHILITGGTGSLGKKLVARILSSKYGIPAKVVVFSRDEAKQHQMRMEYKQRKAATDEIIYGQAREIIDFQIGDVRDLNSILSAMKDIDIVINAAALKQVPTCEYYPYEAVKTNVMGAYNIVTAVANYGACIETVVGVSTDKACKPVNVMGMTKAIQERIFIGANMMSPETRFICVRYGNVLASRGSVIPLFHEQIRTGGPVTITSKDMTRFLLSLDDAVDTVFTAIKTAKRGETFIPKAPAVRITDMVDVLIGGRKIEKRIIGIRPGEKIHEVLISEEECLRTIDYGKYYAIQPILPELHQVKIKGPALNKEYTSADNLMNKSELLRLLKNKKLLVGDVKESGGELLV